MIEARQYVEAQQFAERMSHLAELAQAKVSVLALSIVLAESQGQPVAELERELTDAQVCLAGWTMAADCLRRSIAAERRMLAMVGIEPQSALIVVDGGGGETPPAPPAA